MKDQYGRSIEYLRISVTERCNLKCIYCDPDGEQCKKPEMDVLSPEEIERIVQSVAKSGIKKVRITGGEPLLRRDIVEIVRKVAGVEGITDISMTTNGIRLASLAKELKEAGLNRLNISMDSIKPEKFSMITGGGDLQKTIDGIDAAVENDLQPIKINTVLIKGMNDDEIDDFIELTKERPIQVRFIELMPIGEFGEKNSDKIVNNDEIIKARSRLVYLEKTDKGAPAEYYKIPDYQGKVGFISPMSHKFCGACNRIRLTSDGKLRPCLGDNGETDISAYLEEPQEVLDQRIREIIYRKPVGHHFDENFTSSRRMNRIGG
ncbi:MAG TPA: GTP 3',8-cyclase MoaA [Eubacteriaceae bacterium]|nr:GTP 3',8-cyclase MoaA [Eubacteriaceae bacterium]